MGKLSRKLPLIVGIGFICLLVGPFSGMGVPAMGANADYALQGNYIANMLLSARIIFARNLDVIDTEGAKVGKPLPENAPSYFKGLTPAIFGRLISDEFNIRTGVSVRQTTLGKGKFGARNIYNSPDSWEKTVLEKFTSRSYPRGVGFGEFTTLEGDQKLVYRYMLPLYIEKACLRCHGDPATSPTGDGLDMTSHPMEGYKEGEVRGGISVTIPVTERPAFLVNSKYVPTLEERDKP
ncbi:MAG TPA: Tll0287-like domain-containing protein [Candidatus Hypogeohydataceae bacterium YC41]